MKIIAGLGNPGIRYENTRHNVGFMAVRRLIARHRLAEPKKQFDGLVTEWILGSSKSLLILPQTYMNLSGQCVRRYVDFYKISLEDVLVVVDDLDLKFGQLRLRPSGSSGGQKGLQSLIQHLATDQFARLRIGIGRPDGRMNAADYVLQEFSSDEKVELNFVLDDTSDGLETWVRSGIVPAMNLVNQSKK